MKNLSMYTIASKLWERTIMSMFGFRKNKPTNECKFCLLDTNFVSDILEYHFGNKIIDRERTQTLLKSYINPKNNIICISHNTIKELHRKNEIFEQFQKCPDLFKFCVLHSFDKIIILEKNRDITKKEDLFFLNKPKDIKRFLNNKKIKEILEKTKKSDKDIANDMLDLYEMYKKKERNGETKTEIEKEVIEDAKKNYFKKLLCN